MRAPLYRALEEARAIETPVTISGTYDRPIHRAEQLLGRERVQVSTGGIRAGA